MRLTLIAAMAQNRVIGADGQLPWHLPQDLAHFKALTLHKPIVMGRLTYESIGRPLPRRRNLVLTRTRDYQPIGVDVFHSLEQVIKATELDEELMVIGGGQIYTQSLPLAQRIQLTVVHRRVDGDAFFPELALDEWVITHRVDHLSNSPEKPAFSFLQLDRSKGSQRLPDGFPVLKFDDA